MWTTGCPRVRCSRWCPRGFVRDRNGCQTCRCIRGRGIDRVGRAIDTPAPTPGALLSIGALNPKSARRHPCPHVRCYRHCPWGYVYDRYGCQTCQCKRKTTPPPPVLSFSSIPFLLYDSLCLPVCACVCVRACVRACICVCLSMGVRVCMRV